MVVQALKWDVAAVTAGDFVDVILCQLSMIDVDEQSERRVLVRHHALTFVILAALGMYCCSRVHSGPLGITTHRRSIAERGGCLERRLFVCVFVCLSTR